MSVGAGRKKVGKQEPLVSESWSTLATTTISMLETVGALNDDAADDCIEEAAQLAEMNKKRMVSNINTTTTRAVDGRPEEARAARALVAVLDLNSTRCYHRAHSIASAHSFRCASVSVTAPLCPCPCSSAGLPISHAASRRRDADD